MNGRCWAWYPTTFTRLSEPTCMNTGTTLNPRQTSYEIICALDRTPPRNGYFELLAHPANTMPYTPSDEMANTNKIPTFKSAMTPFTGCAKPGIINWLPHGTTAIVISAGTTESIGASVKYTLLT